MKLSSSWLKNGLLIILLLLLTAMVLIGMNGKALAPRKAVFTYRLHDTIQKDPAFYLKGVIHKGHLSMDVKQVDVNKPGDYAITARQSKRSYPFIIRILP